MAHVSNNSGNNEWYTPPDILELARTLLGGIDVDPASNVVAQQSVKAKVFHTKEDSGLTKDWQGSVWMNPPYSSVLIRQFCTKLKEEVLKGNTQSFVTLTNNATETRWFKELYDVSYAFCFLEKRVKFLNPFGQPGQPLQGQVICYRGNNVRGFQELFEQVGCCMVKICSDSNNNCL